MNASAGTPGLWVAFAALAGAVIGSFLNVVIYRLPRDESLLWPGSHCPQCGAAIPVWANVPIVSWLALRGRCAACAAAIPVRYPLVEAATALLFIALVLRYGPGLRALALCVLGAALVAVAFIDAEHWIIPDEITWPGIALGLLVACFAAEPGPRAAILGAVLVGGAMWLLSLAAERYYGEIALGLGDAKLVAMIGAFLGVEAAVGVLLYGSLFGLLQALPGLLRGSVGRRTRIPFGGALAAAGILLAYEPQLSRILIEALARGIAALG